MGGKHVFTQSNETTGQTWNLIFVVRNNFPYKIMLRTKIDRNEDLKMAHKLPLFNIKHDVGYFGYGNSFFFLNIHSSSFIEFITIIITGEHHHT